MQGACPHWRRPSSDCSGTTDQCDSPCTCHDRVHPGSAGRREWRLTVTDDGVGFDVEGLSPMAGFGLQGIRERVEILAGRVEIHSRMDSGTTVEVCIPVGAVPGRICRRRRDVSSGSTTEETGS